MIGINPIASKASERGRLRPALPVEGATRAPIISMQVAKMRGVKL
jgi:hypothetical protein